MHCRRLGWRRGDHGTKHFRRARGSLDSRPGDLRGRPRLSGAPLREPDPHFTATLVILAYVSLCAIVGTKCELTSQREARTHFLRSKAPVRRSSCERVGFATWSERPPREGALRGTPDVRHDGRQADLTRLLRSRSTFIDDFRPCSGDGEGRQPGTRQLAGSLAGTIGASASQQPTSTIRRRRRSCAH